MDKTQNNYSKDKSQSNSFNVKPCTLLTHMAKAKHYCASCDTHFGGPPNNITPQEHADIAHDSGIFKGIKNGTKKDWDRRQNHKHS